MNTPEDAGRVTSSVVSPVTLDWLARHAAARPQSIALRTAGADISYEELTRRVTRVARALEAQGLCAFRSVAIAAEDSQHRWLLLLACEALGLSVASFRAVEGQGARGLIAAVDHVLTDQPTGLAVGRERVIDAAWFERALSQPPQAVPLTPRGRAEDQALVIRTSGTTGVQRLIRLTRQVLGQRIAASYPTVSPTGHWEELLILPVTVATVYFRALACFRSGGTVLEMPLGQALRTAAPTGAAVLPLEIQRQLKALPASVPSAPNLTFVTFGGWLPESVRQTCVERLGASVRQSYGCNEVGPVADLAADGSWQLRDGVEVQIVDALGAATPGPGEVLLRTPYMASGLSTESAGLGGGGWWQPCDRARWVRPGHFELLGRSNEVLNVAGIKCDTAAVERALLGLPSVLGAAVAMVRRPGGGEERLGLLVVPAPSVDPVALGRELQKLLPAWADILLLATIDALPQMPSGKVDRNRVRLILEASIPA